MSEPYKKPKRIIPLRDDLPLFDVTMAASFFDLNPRAFKKKEQYFIDYNGEKIIATRTPGNQRRYSLNDLLKIAHALRRQNKMTDRQLRLIVLRIDAFKEPVKKHRLRYRKGMKNGLVIPANPEGYWEKNQ